MLKIQNIDAMNKNTSVLLYSKNTRPVCFEKNYCSNAGDAQHTYSVHVSKYLKTSYLEKRFVQFTKNALSLHLDMSTKDNTPKSLKWWLQVAVAIISAIIGMLSEAKLSVVTSLIN